jgi:hypothetical protein
MTTDRITYVLIPAYFAVSLAGLVYLVVTFPQRVKNALRDDVPRRRASDFLQK